VPTCLVHNCEISRRLFYSHLLSPLSQDQIPFDPHQQVLQVLQKNKLFLCLEKCKFCKEQIEYLGLVISENEVSMDLVKVTGVWEWPIPKNKTDIQVFLGFANFYQRFIWDFSIKAQPLFDLTRSEQVWMWGGKKQAAFEDLKTVVTVRALVHTKANDP